MQGKNNFKPGEACSNVTAGEKNCILHLSAMEKLYTAVMPIVPDFDSFLLHIKDAGYKFATAPFSSRPGWGRGEIFHSGGEVEHCKLADLQ